MVKKFLCIVGVLFAIGSCFGQETDLDPLPRNCEDGASGITRQASNFLTYASNREVIVLVARLGNREKSRTLNRRRLHNVVRGLLDRGVRPDQVVVAIGNRTSGLGRVELYWNGRAQSFFTSHENADLCIRCCGPNNNYYPDRKK